MSETTAAELKSYGVVLVVVLVSWLVSASIVYMGGSCKLFLFVFFEGANVYTVGGLVAVVLIRPPEITFRFPRLYASIACYLSSLVAFIYWYILSETNTVFYLGGGLSFVGTIWLMKSFRRNPTQTYTADDFSSQSARSGSDLVTIVDGRWYNPGLQGKHLVKFERGWCFLEETGKRTTWIKPIQVFRADNVTLRVDTGRWRYGTLTLNFGSSFDADKAEDGLRRIMN